MFGKIVITNLYENENICLLIIWDNIVIVIDRIEANYFLQLLGTKSDSISCIMNVKIILIQSSNHISTDTNNAEEIFIC